MSVEKQHINTPALLNLVEDLLNIDRGSLTSDTRLVNVSAWDSMGVLLLMAELDERFGITLNEAALANLRSTADIIDVVRREGLLTE
ncbi:MAG: acyl carrier protein [Gammaproteobacteria bacterium]|nr:MAG: acyl carrier protein [Gammaproteobacteria bacterium]